MCGNKIESWDFQRGDDLGQVGLGRVSVNGWLFSTLDLTGFPP